MQQNVKTRFSALCVFSSAVKYGEYGTTEATGLEEVDDTRERAGGALGLAVLFSLDPPSCVLVGIDVALENSATRSDGSTSSSSVVFLFRFLIAFSDTVAAFNGILSVTDWPNVICVCAEVKEMATLLL